MTMKMSKARRIQTELAIAELVFAHGKPAIRRYVSFSIGGRVWICYALFDGRPPGKALVLAQADTIRELVSIVHHLAHTRRNATVAHNG